MAKTLGERVSVLESEILGTNGKGLGEKFDNFTSEVRRWITVGRASTCLWLQSQESTNKRRLLIIREVAMWAAVLTIALRLFKVI